MSSTIWLGNCGGFDEVAQIDNFTPANVEIGDVFTLTATGPDGSTKAISFTATAATVANVTAGLAAAWNASTDPRCTPVTAADATTYLTLTADTPGVPFSVASSATDGGGTNTQTLARTVGTANRGRYDWSTDLNWSGGAVPVSGDDVVIQSGAYPIYYGLNQASVTLGTLKVLPGYTGTIGVNDYYLRVGTGAFEFNNTAAQASIDLRASNIDAVVKATKVPSDNTRGLYLLGSNLASLTVNKGVVGVAAKGAETATIGTLNVGYTTTQNTDSKVLLGSGVTVTTVSQSGGQVEVNSNVTTLNLSGGTYYQNAGVWTTANVSGGTAYPNAAGTYVTTNVYDTGSLVNTDPRAKTMTNAVLGSGATFTDNLKAITLTNGIDFYACGVDDCSVSLGKHLTLTPSAI